MASLHPSSRPPRQLNAPGVGPKTRNVSRQTPNAGCNSHRHHKARYTSAPSGAARQPSTPFFSRRHQARRLLPQGIASLQAAPPPRVARGCIHHPAFGRGQPHLPDSRPPDVITHLPRRPGHCVDRTQTCSKSSRKKETRTKTPTLAKDPTSPSYHRHPHGTLWGQT